MTPQLAVLVLGFSAGWNQGYEKTRIALSEEYKTLDGEYCTGDQFLPYRRPRGDHFLPYSNSSY